MIEIGGITYADDFCTECPEGFYNPTSNATSCIPCPTNTYSNITGANECTPCLPTEYSYSESDVCTPRSRKFFPHRIASCMHLTYLTACTEDDFESFYSPCDNGTRTLISSWITPVVSFTSHPSSGTTHMNCIV